MTERVDYHRYMASREWALRKREVKERAGNVCERCGKAPIQNVHHLTYERLGNERPEDIQGVCRPCHEFLSAVRDDDPAKPKVAKVYMAGKITDDDWRRSIFQSVREFWVGKADALDKSGEFVYGGPYFEEGKPHDYIPSRHGPTFAREHPFVVLTNNTQLIDEADVVFAWIGADDAYATIWELGYAHAKEKPVFIGVTIASDRLTDKDLRSDLWLITAGADMSENGDSGGFNSPEEAWDAFRAWFREYTSYIGE